MKGSVNVGSHGAKTGGDMGFPGKQPKMTHRNIRRLIKKYPNDIKLQEVLYLELDKYK